MITLLWSASAFAFPGLWLDDATTTRTTETVIARSSSAAVVTVSPEATSASSTLVGLFPVPAAIDPTSLFQPDSQPFRTMDEYSAPRAIALTCEDLYPFLGNNPYGYGGYGYYRNNGGGTPATGNKLNHFGRPGPFACTRLGCDVPGRGGRPGGYYGYYDYGYAVPDYNTRDTGSPDGSLEATAQLPMAEGTWQLEVLPTDAWADPTAWLAEQGLPVPAGASDALAPYVSAGDAFVLGTITLDHAPSGELLPPFQYAYEGDLVTVPLTVGVAASPGVQDDVVIVLSSYNSGAAGIANYPSGAVTDECLVAEDVTDFDAFYDEQVDAMVTATASGGPAVAWTREYAWTNGGCDPCSPAALTSNTVTALGRPEGISTLQTTRLRLRYAPDAVDQDAVVYLTGTATNEQVRFIAHSEELESDFPTCGRDAADDPDGIGSCFDDGPSAERAPQQGSVALPAAGLLAGLLWRRRRSR